MSLAGSDTTDSVLHVAPDPRGGWVVEAGDHSIWASTYATQEQACREARPLVARGWRMVVHPHPADESWTTGGE